MTDIEIRERQRKYLDQFSDFRRMLFERAYAGLGSPRQAIKAKCVSCVGFEEVARRVNTCTVYTCPLHAFRPFQDNTIDNDDLLDSSNNGISEE